MRGLSERERALLQDIAAAGDARRCGTPEVGDPVGDVDGAIFLRLERRGLVVAEVPCAVDECVTHPRITALGRAALACDAASQRGWRSRC